jgi:hypothetical protein
MRQDTIPVVKELAVQLRSSHHSSYKSPYSLLLVAADGRRRRTAAATTGEEQNSSHKVPPEEKGAYGELSAGGWWWTGRRTECGNICLSRWRIYLCSYCNRCRYTIHVVPVMDHACLPCRQGHYSHPCTAELDMSSHCDQRTLIH